MARKQKRAVAVRQPAHDVITSLRFGVFLFSFAYFLATTPLVYASAGIVAMQDAGVFLGDTFAFVAEFVNTQVSLAVGSQVAFLEDVGAVISLAGTTIGEGVHQLVFRTGDFRENLRHNMRTVVQAISEDSL